MTKDTKAPSKPDDPAARAKLCGMAVEEVLERFGCAVVPFMHQPEPVGARGDKLLLSAGYAIVPGPKPEGE